ncbi:DUF354 domain-containing protein [Methanoplanus limicola]|uniref:DUF354 domain-containing protein n=1 Tax=Methanoplanus limicola DSM 2279 TaxID=937775 RepID=H1Z4E1_9EURY|nr:DUF354 domain-containing protein [Methanoplanus limicola]EHQ36689.1 protein of unknown function DUF354 [Methanoplanus limicola DSM 2279]
MRIVIDINHPAQVHFFKNFTLEMKKKGHDILITASKKDLTEDLLKKYKFEYCFLGSYGKSIIKKILNVPIIDIKMYLLVKNFQPDIFLGFGSIRAAHVSKLMGKKCINFDDDEYSYPYYHYFTDTICGFSGFKINGDKVLKINSFKEIAYLHPNYFKPNPELLKKNGIDPYEKFVLVRFVSWNAFHDFGQNGLSAKSKIQLIDELSKNSTIYISSEAPLPKELEKYRLSLPPENIHDLLYYATLLVSDSQTMTTEAAVLGTPAVRTNSFVGNNDMGNFIELEKKYNLIFNCNSNEALIENCINILNFKNVKHEWKIKREKLLEDKSDITKYMIWLIENYPQSINEIKNR